MLTKSLNEVLKGFFWGLGFAISVIGLASVYSLTIAASVDMGFKKNVRSHAMSSFEDFASDYELSLSEIFKENGRVKITAELKNISNDELYAMGVVASTFDSNGRFIKARREACLRLRSVTLKLTVTCSRPKAKECTLRS